MLSVTILLNTAIHEWKVVMKSSEGVKGVPTLPSPCACVPTYERVYFVAVIQSGNKKRRIQYALVKSTLFILFLVSHVCIYVSIYVHKACAY